jgi:hypothetical protein
MIEQIISLGCYWYAFRLGKDWFAASNAGAVAVVFATPFLLVFLQVRSAMASGQRPDHSFTP